MPRTLASGRSLATNRPRLQPVNCALQAGTVTSPNTMPDAGTQSVSFGGWVQPYIHLGQVVWQLLNSAGNGTIRLNIETNTGKLFVFTTTNANVSSTATKPNQAINPNSWSRVWVTYNVGSGLVSLYVNGVLTGSAVPANLPGNTNQFKAITNSQQHIGGTLVYSRELTASEVMRDYLGVLPSGPVLNWPLNEGSQGTAYDVSGNGNNGTTTSPIYTDTTMPFAPRKLVGGNLVHNGNFEFAPPTNAALSTNSRWIDGTSGGVNAGANTTVPFGWGTNNCTGTFGVQFDNTNAHSGTYSMKVSTLAVNSHGEVTLNGNSTTAINRFWIPAMPNTQYLLSGWIMTNLNSGSATRGAGIEILERSGSGATVGGGASKQGIITTTPWTFYTVLLTTGATTEFIYPGCFVDGTGGSATLIMDAWFDDIVIVPVNNTVRSLAV